jgi:hypothetical protein
MSMQGAIHRYTIEGSRASCDVIFKDTLPYMAYNVYIAPTLSGHVLQIKSGDSQTTRLRLKGR